MNILKRELRANLKSFLFWSLGLFFLVFVGMVKYTGIRADVNVSELFDQFPKIVLAVFGMVGLDITTLGGYYSIIIYYAIICGSIYGISLGCNVANREILDRTYEFIYTKPRSRKKILSIKLFAALFYLFFFCIFTIFFSFAAFSSLAIKDDLNQTVLLFTVSMFLVSVLFCCMGFFVSAIVKKAEKGYLYSNLLFLLFFVLSMVYDVLEKNAFLRPFAPLKYFLPIEILNGTLRVSYLFLCIALSAVFYVSALRLFEHKDLTA
ncbi:MAG: beta-exotoxin transport system permease protein [Clostridiales bacterium]|nr:beta-exotoxin transport system permease protein [Clostridiales bacterium]